MNERALQIENEELRERIRQLEQLLRVQVRTMPKALGLTRTEEAVLACLMKHETANRDQLMHALYGSRGLNMRDPKNIDVHVSKLRKNLKERGIEIKTDWGRGYSLTSASKDVIQQMLSPEPVE